MDRNRHPTNAATLPASSTGANAAGFFTKGDPLTSTAATIPTADWANGITEELINVLTSNGLTPTLGINTQLNTAILNSCKVNSRVKQVVAGTFIAGTGSTTVATPLLPADGTVPQITEGLETMTTVITPSAATSVLEITVTVTVKTDTAGIVGIALFRDATANALYATGVTLVAGATSNLNLTFRVAAASVAATTFRLRYGSNVAAVVTINTLTVYGAAATPTMHIKEILV